MTNPAAQRHLCPACLGSFLLTNQGALRRHGFSAHFPQGQQGGGFHIGSCIGTSKSPIGTDMGNALAIGFAIDHERIAGEMAARPPHTAEQATDAAMREAWASENRRGRHQTPLPHGTTPADFARTSCRGFFYPDAIAARMSSMDRMREADIKAHRDHAAALRKAVAENPSD